KGDVLSAGAVKILASDPIRVWGGAGVLTLDGEDYQGVGDSGMIMVTGAQLGGTEDGIDLSLSGVDPDLSDLATTNILKNARVTIWRLLFDGSGQALLDAQVFERGRVDKVAWKDVPGRSATIVVTVETAARGLGRRSGRTTSDADQRMIDADD